MFSPARQAFLFPTSFPSAIASRSADALLRYVCLIGKILKICFGFYFSLTVFGGSGNENARGPVCVLKSGEEKGRRQTSSPLETRGSVFLSSGKIWGGWAV